MPARRNTASVPGARAHVTANRLSSGETHPSLGPRLAGDVRARNRSDWSMEMSLPRRVPPPAFVGDSGGLHAIHIAVSPVHRPLEPGMRYPNMS